MATWEQSQTGETLVPTLGQFSSPTVPDSFSQAQPQQPPPQQQQASAPSEGSEALLNLAIQNKQIAEDREGIQSRRTALLNNPSSYIRDRHGGMHMNPKAQGELHGFDVEERNLQGRERLSEFTAKSELASSMQNTRMAHQYAQDALHQQTADQASEVFLRGTEIMAKYKPGTQEFHDEMVKLKEQYPLGFRAEAVGGHFGPIAKFHTQELNTAQKLAATDLAKAGLTPDEFASHTNPRRGKIDETTGEFTNQYTGAEKGKIMAFDIGGKTFHAPVDVYNRVNKVLGRPDSPIKQAIVATQPAVEPVGMVSTQRGQPLRPISPQPVATVQAQVDPRIELARRAIADPNASPAHKAAAKRILGIQ